jgi:putative endopeptidase
MVIPKLNSISISILISILFLRCHSSSPNSDSIPRTLSLQFIDYSVKPGDNFYYFANGKWLDTAAVLPWETRAGARLDMDYLTKSHIRTLLEEAAASDPPKGSIEQKVGNFFASGMDTLAIEKLGFEPINLFLHQIDSIGDGQALMRWVATQWTLGSPLLIGQIVLPDDKNPSTILVMYYQAGLRLPDRDFYFRHASATKRIRLAYRKYIFMAAYPHRRDSITH